MAFRFMVTDATARVDQSARLGMTAVALVGFATWALGHAYQGIFHDAGLYTLQALAHLRPDALGGDVFLKFGSQDRFTLFSPLYAAFAGWFGVESAAALLTLLFQCGLLLAAAALASTVMPRPWALLGVGVLLAIPGDYGADRIFTCIEAFLTPRMAAEAFVLAALAAALRGSKGLAVALTLAAALLHPIMAMAGVSALYWLYLGESRPVIAAALAIVGLKALALAAFFMPWARFDAGWLASVNARSPYLFLANWQLDDWARAAVAAATLVAGVRALPDARARALARVAVITSASGLVLALIAGDLLHLVLFTQLQPWRWQWLGTVVAALLLPQILHGLWNGDRAARTAGILLLAAWVFAANAYALAAAAGALLCLGLLSRLKPGESRWVYAGALALLALAGVWRLASNLQLTDAHYADPDLPSWLRAAASFTRDGAAPAALMALAAWLAQTRRGRPALLLLAVLAGGACAALGPQTWHRWTAREFSERQVAGFADFRRRIPPGAEVFWPESPVGVWLLLERPSYLSVIQTSGLVFSQPAARELQRRAAALAGAVSPASFMTWNGGAGALNLTGSQLAAACATGAFAFLVTAADLGSEPVAVKAGVPGAAARPLRLYRCDAAAAAT